MHLSVILIDNTLTATLASLCILVNFWMLGYLAFMMDVPCLTWQKANPNVLVSSACFFTPMMESLFLQGVSTSSRTSILVSTYSLIKKLLSMPDGHSRSWQSDTHSQHVKCNGFMWLFAFFQITQHFHCSSNN